MEKAIVVFDVDGTFLREHLLLEWLKGLTRRELLPRDVLSEARFAVNAYRQRNGQFQVYVNHLVYVIKTQLKGINVAESMEIGSNLVQNRGGLVHVFPRELCAAALEARYHTAAISGSPLHAVRPFADRYGIHEAFGTTFAHHDDRFTGDIEHDWIEANGKGRALDILTQRLALNLKESVAIGDTTGDVPMLEKVGFPICFNPSRELLQVAKTHHWPIVVERKDVCYIHVWDCYSQAYQLDDAPDSILPNILLKTFQPRFSAHFG